MGRGEEVYCSRPRRARIDDLVGCFSVFPPKVCFMVARYLDFRENLDGLSYRVFFLRLATRRGSHRVVRESLKCKYVGK